MKKVLGLFLMAVLCASVSFGSITAYSFVTGLAPAVAGDGGNKSAGAVVYNDVLNAAFVGMYFTGVGSRAIINGWSTDPLDPTYGSTTPKFYIRDRMFMNGDKLVALKSIYGAAQLYKGKMYFVADRWGFDNLNMVGRTYCPVNADSVSVTFPNVSTKYPLYNVTGVSTSATTPVEDTWGGTQLYKGNSVNTADFTCEANGWAIHLIGSTNALVGVAGVFTDATGLGTNFFTGGGYDESSRWVWLGNMQIPGAPTTVTVRYTDGNYNPNTGVIQLNATLDAGAPLFVHVGQLQPGHRSIWKYDAATLAAETALNIYGEPIMWEACTVASVSLGLTTCYEIGGMSGAITDQFIAGRVPGFDSAKSRLTYTNYGRDSIAGVALSATQVQFNLGGKPISGFYSIYTGASGDTTSGNLWGSRSFAGWLPVTNLAKVSCPWGPINKPGGIWTDAAKVGINFYTGRAAGDTTSQIGAGGPGGYWSVSDSTPEIFAAVGGIDTTLSLGSAWVEYAGMIPDGYSPIVANLMDTTGIANLQIPIPGGATQVWADINRANGLDIANNRVRVIAAGKAPLLAVGDTTYICYLKQAGANPYLWKGVGSSGNRSVTANPYGVTFDKDGSYFVPSLWDNQWGFFAHDANGNFIQNYPMKGGYSTVARGQIGCDTTTGDIYWADGAGVVWRWQKTGAGLDTYVQNDLPFYLGSVNGSNGAGLGGQTNGVRVKTVPTTLAPGTITLVYLTTNQDMNATTPAQNVLTIMRTNGVVDATVSIATSGTGAAQRGLDVSPDGTKVILGNWAGPSGYPEMYLLTGPQVVPVGLSRFESLVY